MTDKPKTEAPKEKSGDSGKVIANRRQDFGFTIKNNSQGGINKNQNPDVTNSTGPKRK